MVWPKLRMARTPFSVGSSCTTRTFTAMARSMSVVRVASSRSRMACTRFSMKANSSGSPMAPALTISLSPHRYSRSGSDASRLVSVATMRGG